MKFSSILKVAALGLCVVGSSLIGPTSWGQQSPKGLVKVSGADLQAWLSKNFVIAGENLANGCVYMIVGEASRRTQFYSCPDGKYETVEGTQRVVGDTLCTTWSYAEERCREFYKIGENRYEQWTKGAHTATVYIVK
jgi:hypothetical protein